MKCVFCKKEVEIEKDFKDEISKKEFVISGLCQSCQDRIFSYAQETEEYDIFDYEDLRK